MNLSISNIAWTAENDKSMYPFLERTGYNGIEIAPTRIYPENPYDRLNEAKDLATMLKEKYKLSISSIQSIWYGRQENIFGSGKERKILIDYTRKAAKFAKTIGCKNLVFGCPRNRETLNVSRDYPIAIDFFHTLGEIALENNTVIAIEANPTIYNTHFINYTEQAVELVSKINSNGIKVNYDLGTAIYNNEDWKYITSIGSYINHVHISEPSLAVIQFRTELHKNIIDFTKNLQDVFISIEMGKQSDLFIVKSIMEYIKKISE